MTLQPLVRARWRRWAMPVRRRPSRCPAGATSASAPVLLINVYAQRFTIEGVSRSGVKG